MSLSAFRDQFEPAFRTILHQKVAVCAAWVPDALVADLIRYPEKLAAGGGKRVRPYLAWLGAGAGLRNEALLRTVSALELFHLFALVHDDIMDRGNMRRGVLTVHAHVTRQLSDLKRIGDLSHVGEAQALLVGDLLAQWAQEVFQEATTYVPPERFHAARAAFNAMVNEVIVGQMIDIDITTRASVPAELIHTKMKLKTASYTFVRPMQIGLALAGQRTDTPWIAAYGLALGVAFQMQDDLMDLTSTHIEAGKTVFSDLRANQPTLLTHHIVEKGTDAQRAELASLMGTTLTEADRPRVTKLFEESGAIAAAKAEITRLFVQAGDALTGAPTPLRTPLAELLTAVQQRTS